MFLEENMKIAIVGPRSPLAEAFIDKLRKSEDLWSLSFYHTSDLSPLIEFKGEEIPVRPINGEYLKEADPEVVIFFPQEDYREAILATELLDLKIIDTTGAFIGDPTIPLILPPVNDELVLKHNLVSLPSFDTALFVPVLYGLDRRFHIKRASIIAQDKEPTKDFFRENDYDSEEINSINEMSKILDNDSLRITVTHKECDKNSLHNYFLNISMARPFNTEDLLAQLKIVASVYSQKDLGDFDLTKDLILRRYRRDLSLDSGIHLWISTEDPQQPLLRAILTVLEKIKAG